MWCDAEGLDSVTDMAGVSVMCAGVSRGNDGVSLVTSGGRVMSLVVTASNVETAASKAQLAASTVNFTDKTFRTDIALKALQSRSLFVHIE